MQRKPTQSVKRWRMVRVEEKQYGQVGSSSTKSKCLCVNLQLPILRRVRITSIFQGVNVGQIAMYGFIQFVFNFHIPLTLPFFLYERVYSQFQTKSKELENLRIRMLVQQLYQQLQCPHAQEPNKIKCEIPCYKIHYVIVKQK